MVAGESNREDPAMNETPAADGEPTEAVPATPSAPAAPGAPETPEAVTTPLTYDQALNPAGDEDDVEAPAAVAAAAPERPAGIFIPKWVGLVAAAIVAALVFGG